jgi:hypothetical protein
MVASNQIYSCTNSLRVYPLLGVKSNYLVASLTGLVAVKPFPSAHDYSHQEEKRSSIKVMSRCRSEFSRHGYPCVHGTIAAPKTSFTYGASVQVFTFKLVQIDIKRRVLVLVGLGRQGRHSEALVSVGRCGACCLTRVAREQDQDHTAVCLAPQKQGTS